MRATISTGLLVLLIGCGGRTLLDDPSDELPLGEHPSSSSSGGGGASTEHDASADAEGTETDAGKSGGSGTISCGTMSCNASTETCCATMTGTMSGAASCVAKAKCTGVAVSCTSAADCSSGESCCGSFPGGMFSIANLMDISVTCAKSCSATGFQLCAKDSECAKGVTCQTTPIGPSPCGGLSAFGF